MSLENHIDVLIEKSEEVFGNLEKSGEEPKTEDELMEIIQGTDYEDFEEFFAAIAGSQKQLKPMVEYLAKLDSETLLDIEAIMYIGRDIACSQPTANSLEEQKKILPAEGDKIIIQAIVSKGTHLSTYLRNGEKAIQ